MSVNHKTPKGEGSLRPVEQAEQALPKEVTKGDLELMLTFQQNVQSSQQAYQMIMSQFAARYLLREGDSIGMDGSIVRKS